MRLFARASFLQVTEEDSIQLSFKILSHIFLKFHSKKKKKKKNETSLQKETMTRDVVSIQC